MIKQIYSTVGALFVASAMFVAPIATAEQGPFILSDDLSCASGYLDDVTFGGASPSAVGCWGLLPGNDWQDAGGVNLVGFPELENQEGFYIDSLTGPTAAYSGTLFERAAKQDVPSGSDSDNGYDVQISISNPGKSGTWSLSGADANLGGNSFLLAIKASNEYLIWLFAGDPVASSYAGTWKANWGHDISHMSIYASTGERPEIPEVPLPSTLALLFLGGLFMSKRVPSRRVR